MLLDYLLNHRFDYEESARKQIIDKLKSEDLKSIFQQGGLKGEHRICVFGESHVGKTTLILKLLGAKSKIDDPISNIIELGNAIRGNKEKKSAGTSSVFQYSVNIDKTFVVHFPGENELICSELSEVENILNELRKQVERKEWKSLDPIKIKLSNLFFHEKEKKKWIITDIPGVASSVKEEHEHVNRIIQTWVLGSNVILVLVDASKIASLNSPTLHIPGYGPWHYLGRRCRLIITRAFTKNSVRESFKREELLDEDAIVNYFKEMIYKESKVNISNIDKIYPLDYGDTWDAFQRDFEVLYNQVNPYMENFFSYLEESLERSLDPKEEYKSLMDITRLEKKVEEELEEINTELCKIKVSIDQLEQEKLNYQTQKINSDEFEWINNKINELNDKKVIRFTRPNYQNEFESYHSDSTENRNSEQRKHEERLRQWLGDFSNKITGDSELLILEIQYVRFSKDWWQYDYTDTREWRGEYYGIFNVIFRIKNWGNWARDNHSKAFRNMIFDQFRYWENKVEEAKNHYIFQKVNELKDELYKNENYNNLLNTQIGYNDNEIIDKRKEIKRIEENISLKQKLKNEDFALFKNEYPKLRKNELSNSINEQIKLINNEIEPLIIEQRLAYINALESQFNTM